MWQLRWTGRLVPYWAGAIDGIHPNWTSTIYGSYLKTVISTNTDIWQRWWWWMRKKTFHQVSFACDTECFDTLHTLSSLSILWQQIVAYSCCGFLNMCEQIVSQSQNKHYNYKQHMQTTEYFYIQNVSKIHFTENQHSQLCVVSSSRPVIQLLLNCWTVTKPMHLVTTDMNF